MRIRRLTRLPAAAASLVAAAEQEGFGFMTRLAAEWQSGANRFDRPGELLLGASTLSGLVALGGLNRDPYASAPGIGRLRHLYVLPGLRRQGIAAALVQSLIAAAAAPGSGFHSLRLRCDTPAAAAFYARLGFAPVDDAAATHSLRLPPG